MEPPPDVRFESRPFRDLSLDDLYGVLCLRDETFVVGQRIVAEPEADGQDPRAVHVVGRDPAGRIVATARVFLDERPARVGRVAVHPTLQRQGVGTALMAAVHDLLDGRSAVLSAQAHLRPWYERLGWRAEGPLYDEAGIPHRRMYRPGRDPGPAPSPDAGSPAGGGHLHDGGLPLPAFDA